MGNLRRVIPCPHIVLCFSFHLTCHDNFGFLMSLVAVGSCYVWRHCNPIWLRRHNTGRHVGEVETCSKGKASQVSVNWTARKIYARTTRERERERASTYTYVHGLAGFTLEIWRRFTRAMPTQAQDNAWVNFPSCKLTQEMQNCVPFLALALNLRLNFTHEKRDNASANVRPSCWHAECSNVLARLTVLAFALDGWTSLAHVSVSLV